MKRAPMQRRYRYTGPDLGTVLRMLERDGHGCVRCRGPIRGDRGRDWVAHHRRPRGAGGSGSEDTNGVANLLSLCARCHNHIESNRAEALANGWLVPQGQDPAAVPVLVGRRRVFLTAEGLYAEGLT